MNIKIRHERTLDPRNAEGIAWGMAEDGSAVLAVSGDGQRLMIAMPPEFAIETGVGACHVGQGLKEMREQAAGKTAPSSLLVDSAGIPLGGR